MNLFKPALFCIFLLTIFTASSIDAYCQDIELKGKVISATNQAIPYVNINIPAKGISTISNEEGIFVLKFGGDILNDSVTFSCVGYTPQTLMLKDAALKESSLVITLPESVVTLKEVVIKPVTIKELLDSIVNRNSMAFASPMKLNGYYREFVFTNSKCNEYSDALFDYYYDRNVKNTGLLKIVASRCEKAVKKNDSNQNFEAFIDSKANPDKMFNFAMLTAMIKEFFSDKQLTNYKYIIQGNESNKDIVVTIYPKPGTDKVYKLQFLLTDDFILKSYKLEIPGELLKNVAERSMLGIHGKITAFTIEARYRSSNGEIYPQYFKISKDVKIYGKFMGTVLNQLTAQKSEFVITQINTKNVSPIPKNEAYKKGNICDNGVAINTALLTNYNFILPTKKDSLAISSIAKDISAD